MAINLILLLLFSIALSTDVNAYSLKQVLVLSRHNIRTPLISGLDRTTPKAWPKWAEPVAHLTSKGALMENYMGDYFSSWLKKEGLFNKDCPSEGSIHIFANAPERTKSTATNFLEAAFKNCDVPVIYRSDVAMDPIFNPIIHNTSKEAKYIVYNEMQEKLHVYNLTEAFLKLNRILDITESAMCKEDSICDLTLEKDIISYEVGKEPNITIGPLAIGNSVVDSFLMEYYSGVSFNTIAWGKLRETDIKLLTDITKANQDVRFNSSIIAKDVAKPLLNHITDILTKETIKFTLLVGHDSNLNSVMAALRFKSFDLPGQFEKTPIGGKIVFQKWYDEELKRNLLKINYVYQTMMDIREGIRPTLENPPQWITMELHGCAIDSAGFCSWAEFMTILQSL